MSDNSVTPTPVDTTNDGMEKKATDKRAEVKVMEVSLPNDAKGIPYHTGQRPNPFLLPTPLCVCVSGFQHM
jgi:hypothetical protein